MDELLKILCNIRSLRAAMRNIPIDTQEKIQENVLTVVQENQATFQAQEEERLRIEREKEGVLQKVNEMLAEKGMTLDDLVPTIAGQGSAAPVVKSQGKKRKPREAKYAWNQDGVEKTWTGQGKTPTFLATQLAAGRTLEEFLIKKD